MKEAKELLEKFKSGTCTAEELTVLDRWIHQMNEDEFSKLTTEDLTQAKQKLKEEFSSYSKSKYSFKMWQRLVAASMIVFLLMGGLYFYKIEKQLDGQVQKDISDVLPGGDMATLTLADGEKIDLDSLPEGYVITMKGSQISKSAQGELVYATSYEDNTDDLEEFHLIETPVRGQYRIVLPDGSKVWLNAASSLKFKASFSGIERQVFLQGEGFFEVAKDKNRPFRVISNGQQVEVLGTQFNIKCYPDEPLIKTSLLEGSVKVSPDPLLLNDSKGYRIILPGQQSMLSKKGFKVKKVDMDQVLDWKNGDFIFQEESLGFIMKRVSRWYGVDVYFDSAVDIGQTFSGQVSRSKNLSEVIKCLESTGELKFERTANKIKIIKNPIN